MAVLNDVFLNLLLNVGLLVLVATMLTQLPVVKHMLLDENNTLWSRSVLAVLFGGVSILSTYTGTQVQGAIVNTRVIGVMAAGLLGGPYVGVMSALIAGCHRYLFDIGGFTALSCAVSTFAEGAIGAMFSKYFRRGRWDSLGIFLITAVAEICQMLIILAIAKPFEEALELVQIIALPMILLNALGMVAFIHTFNVVFLEADHAHAGQIGLALQIVERCLPHLRNGLYDRKEVDATAQILYEAFPCYGVLISDRQEILAHKLHPKIQLIGVIGSMTPSMQQAMQIGGTASLEHVEKGDSLFRLMKNYSLISAPLKVRQEPVGTLTMIVRKQWYRTGADTRFVEELARLFSTQIELSELDYQKRLRRKAELQALQSQVNPHFLYNALNTIASVCRESGDRARELLLTLSTYYRHTLENTRYMNRLHTELYQVSNYLKLEKARFEEKLIVEMDVPESMDCMVPAFILQPLVENAVRHGAGENGVRFVRIEARETEQGIHIAVSDHGKGFDQKILEQLSGQGESLKSFGLLNVHKRLKSIYGEQQGLQINNTDNGAVVSFTITDLTVRMIHSGKESA